MRVIGISLAIVSMMFAVGVAVAAADDPDVLAALLVGGLRVPAQVPKIDVIRGDHDSQRRRIRPPDLDRVLVGDDLGVRITEIVEPV